MTRNLKITRLADGRYTVAIDNNGVCAVCDTNLDLAETLHAEGLAFFDECEQGIDEENGRKQADIVGSMMQ